MPEEEGPAVSSCRTTIPWRPKNATARVRNPTTVDAFSSPKTSAYARRVQSSIAMCTNSQPAVPRAFVWL
jgi:hypothetical protein